MFLFKDTLSYMIKHKFCIVKQLSMKCRNVITYEVVISASNADLKLKPGLTANVTIYTQERPGVLSVPSKPLRFTPTKETIGKQYTIQDITNAKNKVWTLESNVLKAHRVNIGMTDGNHTEISSLTALTLLVRLFVSAQYHSVSSV
jgi:periplasmic component of efflux system